MIDEVKERGPDIQGFYPANCPNPSRGSQAQYAETFAMVLLVKFFFWLQGPEIAGPLSRFVRAQNGLQPRAESSAWSAGGAPCARGAPAQRRAASTSDSTRRPSSVARTGRPNEVDNWGVHECFCELNRVVVPLHSLQAVAPCSLVFSVREAGGFPSPPTNSRFTYMCHGATPITSA